MDPIAADIINSYLEPSGSKLSIKVSEFQKVLIMQLTWNPNRQIKNRFDKYRQLLNKVLVGKISI